MLNLEDYNSVLCSHYHRQAYKESQFYNTVLCVFAIGYNVSGKKNLLKNITIHTTVLFSHLLMALVEISQRSHDDLSFGDNYHVFWSSDMFASMADVKCRHLSVDITTC